MAMLSRSFALCWSWRQLPRDEDLSDWRIESNVGGNWGVPCSNDLSLDTTHSLQCSCRRVKDKWDKSLLHMGQWKSWTVSRSPAVSSLVDRSKQTLTWWSLEFEPSEDKSFPHNGQSMQCVGSGLGVRGVSKYPSRTWRTLPRRPFCCSGPALAS